MEKGREKQHFNCSNRSIWFNTVCATSDSNSSWEYIFVTMFQMHLHIHVDSFSCCCQFMARLLIHSQHFVLAFLCKPHSPSVFAANGWCFHQLSCEYWLSLRLSTQAHFGVVIVISYQVNLACFLLSTQDNTSSVSTIFFLKPTPKMSPQQARSHRSGW